MTMGTVVPLTAPAVDLRCSKCGATTHAHCDCGVAYVPVSAIVAPAIAKPENATKTNRALAAELGIDERTVRRARAGSGAAFAAPEKRVGKDGKSYPARQSRRLVKSAARAADLSEDDLDPLGLREKAVDDWGGKGASTKERWNLSASNLMSEIASMTAYWDQNMPGWREFQSSSSLRSLTAEAKSVFTEIVSKIELAGSPAHDVFEPPEHRPNDITIEELHDLWEKFGDAFERATPMVRSKFKAEHNWPICLIGPPHDGGAHPSIWE